MPFDSVNATTTFERLMDWVLEGQQEYCTSYVDDKFVYSWLLKKLIVQRGLVMERQREGVLTE